MALMVSEEKLESLFRKMFYYGEVSMEKHYKMKDRDDVDKHVKKFIKECKKSP